jgi:hypothetical protein
MEHEEISAYQDDKKVNLQLCDNYAVGCGWMFKPKIPVHRSMAID